jgi:Domain of unknown function (DUF4351)
MNLSPLYLEQISLAEQRGAEKARAEMLSHLYLKQISQAEQRGRIEILFRQLNRQVGKLSPALELQVITFSVSQIGDLGEALLNFHQEEDLLLWLSALN